MGIALFVYALPQDDIIDSSQLCAIQTSSNRVDQFGRARLAQWCEQERLSYKGHRLQHRPSLAVRVLHASVLATEGAERLGIKAFSGPPKRIYKQLREQFPKQPESNFFSDLQVKLCAKLPALGLFRVLIF